jgi:hypothetical protein
MCGARGRWHLIFRQRPGEERQLYESQLGWQKKIVFPFVVAARKTSFFHTEKFRGCKREE